MSQSRGRRNWSLVKKEGSVEEEITIIDLSYVMWCCTPPLILTLHILKRPAHALCSKLTHYSNCSSRETLDLEISSISDFSIPFGMLPRGPRQKIKTYRHRYSSPLISYQNSSKSVQPLPQKTRSKPFWPLINIILKIDR